MSTGTNSSKRAPQRSGSSSSRKKMSAKKRKAKQRRRIIFFAVEIVALIVLLIAIVGVNMVTKIDKIKINEEDIVVNPQVENNKEMKGYRNIALFGVDSRKGKLGKGSRSDTVMIASINQDTGDVKLVSVYRDTYLNLGTDSYNKANAAYAQGGPEQAINMLNMNFDLDITEYVTVGFDALIETIDELGGIDIDVHDNEIDHLNNYQRSMFVENENDALNENIVKVTHSGMQTLSGLQATAYCRIRYVGDDFGRAERQRKVLMACMDKAKTMSPTTLVSILNKVMDAAAAHKNGKGADLVGINMEGPFISPKKVGAQNPEYVQGADAAMFRRLQKRANGLIKLVDVAPEEPGNLDFIKECHNEVRISIAHTCTDYDTAVKAFEAGATHMTHLYNAMPGITHRAPGPIIAAMEHDAEVELITDNVHIHPAMVRFTFNTFGDDRICLIADSAMSCGLPDGQYSLGGQAITVKGPRATLTEHPDTIAGSNTCLYDCMKRAVLEMNVPLESAVRAASETPAKSIGVDNDYGSLAAGRYGNVILADKELNLKAVIQKGVRIV